MIQENGRRDRSRKTVSSDREVWRSFSMLIYLGDDKIRKADGPGRPEVIISVTDQTGSVGSSVQTDEP